MSPQPPQAVRTRRYVELRQGGIVLSRLPLRPAATHTLLDVVAAAGMLGLTSAARAEPPSRTGRTAVLGFAAGGVVAPLRALGATGPIDGVDVSTSGFHVFHDVAASWGPPIQLHTSGASAWLKSRRTRFAVIIEDLSEYRDGIITKPWESIFHLPPWIRARLSYGGVAVTNVLPFPGASWRALLGNLAAPFAKALVIELNDYENRILACGDQLPTARRASVELKRALTAIHSRQARRFSVRTLC